ncbi:DUF86 domain-containing protein [Thermodesulfovibrio sp. Kuro-1]|uniref:HepT-like ribonuclease domain-containing protein n=1 Tax=Thermodesulfovibrio TaxID=28261 RepID=UPI0011430A55|nr:DUF86 domain-containing protein [Thermodesulfovibrio sp. Kuro-1]
MRKEDELFIRDILTVINLIENFIQDIDFKRFIEDEKTKSAILWQIHIIGEATKKLSKDLTENSKEIPWKYMAKMRDKIAHFYFGIDYEISWDVIKNKLPIIKPLIEGLLK